MWSLLSRYRDRGYWRQALPSTDNEHGHHTEELLYSSVPLWSTSTLKTVQWTCISGRDGRDGHVRRMCGIQCADLCCRDCFQACCVNCVKQKPMIEAWSKLKWNKHLCHLCHLNAKKEYLRHQKWQHQDLDSLTWQEWHLENPHSAQILARPWEECEAKWKHRNGERKERAILKAKCFNNGSSSFPFVSL